MVLGSHENIINAVFRIVSQHPNKEKLTLTEIAEEAGMTRQAIYKKHYHNVDEIFEDIHTSITQEAFAQLEKVMGSQKYLSFYDIVSEVIIPTIYKNRMWGRFLYSSMMKARWEQFLDKEYAPILDHMATTVINHGPFPQKSMIKIMRAYVFAIIAEWISEDFPEPPEIFAKKFQMMMESTPKFLIDGR
ncbi:TetR/AcrR family transcriptional regulator [Streptococcus dentasini]